MLENCKPCAFGLRVFDHKKCFGCAVRLVASARPSRKQQESMLAITQQNHDRDELIEAVKKLSP